VSDGYTEEEIEVQPGVFHVRRTYGNGTVLWKIPVPPPPLLPQRRRRRSLRGVPAHRMNEDEITRADREDAGLS
jgi:hypothetical protein